MLNHIKLDNGITHMSSILFLRDIPQAYAVLVITDEIFSDL